MVPNAKGTKVTWYPSQLVAKSIGTNVKCYQSQLLPKLLVPKSIGIKTTATKVADTKRKKHQSQLVENSIDSQVNWFQRHSVSKSIGTKTSGTKINWYHSQLLPNKLVPEK